MHRSLCRKRPFHSGRHELVMKLTNSRLKQLVREVLEEKDDEWIQDAEKDIEKRGTEGVCTGDKFGSESCPPGSKRYNLAKTFRKMAKKRKNK